MGNNFNYSLGKECPFLCCSVTHWFPVSDLSGFQLVDCMYDIDIIIESSLLGNECV